MYIPAFNKVLDDHKIDRLIADYGFATLITQKEGALCASHLPVLMAKSSDGERVLRSHMAKANAQWRHFTPAAEVLCIFSGPHAYISPSWYQMQHTVPTWNYATVHVYGQAKIIDDTSALRQIVLDTTEKYESTMPQPWQVPLAEEEMDAMLKAVVGFTVDVRRVEAKFKLGQNRSREDQMGMVNGLLGSADGASQALGKFIARDKVETGGGTEERWP